MFILLDSLNINIFHGSSNIPGPEVSNYIKQNPWSPKTNPDL